jgi:hypothetical protein
MRVFFLPTILGLYFTLLPFVSFPLGTSCSLQGLVVVVLTPYDGEDRATYAVK